MDINLLAKMVAELILDHDEVSLPGVGTFVAEMVPASFSDKGFTINPPYRKLSFRQREGSGRELIEFYARENHVGEQDAERMTVRFMTELRSELTTRKSVVFPGLGKLRATKENHFFFVPEEDLNIYPEGFGLVPVSLKFHQESEEELSSAIRDLKEIVSPAAQEPAPAPAPEPAPEPAPVPDRTIEPAVEPDPVPQPVAEVPAPAPAVTVPAKEAEAGPEQPVPAPAEPIRQPRTHHSHTYRRRRRGISPWLVTAISLAAAVILFFGALAVLGRVAPQIVDPLLYTPEELSILYR